MGILRRKTRATNKSQLQISVAMADVPKQHEQAREGVKRVHNPNRSEGQCADINPVKDVAKIGHEKIHGAIRAQVFSLKRAQ